MQNTKFRAFIKRLNVTVPVVSVDFENKYIVWDDGQVSREGPPDNIYEIEAFDNIVLFQCSGLKDKDGKDIYEPVDK